MPGGEPSSSARFADYLIDIDVFSGFYRNRTLKWKEWRRKAQTNKRN